MAHSTPNKEHNMTTTTLPRAQVNATAFLANKAHADFADILSVKVETDKEIYRLKQQLANAMRRQELLDGRFKEMLASTTLGLEA